MELNEDGFPNYVEVWKKFDLDHNKELREYIDCMYRRYNEIKDMSKEESIKKAIEDCRRDAGFDMYKVIDIAYDAVSKFSKEDQKEMFLAIVREA